MLLSNRSGYRSLRRFDYRLNQLELNGSREPVVAEKLLHWQTWPYGANVQTVRVVDTLINSLPISHFV